ncbi:hypothetical protein C8J56DRAFT_1165956 [Mycena floridula]|nr:hypothetical protein C8J56DRAFT_1165956 [Mycena floridula]
MDQKSRNSVWPNRLLTTNEPPSANEGVALEEIMEALDNEISEAYQKVSVLKAQFDAACEAHARLLGIRAAHRAVLSPVRLLPSEIVFEILRYASSNDTDSLPVVILDRRQAPWPYMAVCQRWRNIITSHSIFWTNISLSWDGYNSAENAETLQFILHHSKDEPLIFEGAFGWRSLDPQFIRLFQSHSHRWTDLSLTQLVHSAYDELDQAIDQGSLPQLRRLCFSGDLAAPNCFEVAPNLQALEMRSIEFVVTTPLPWAQILYLTILLACNPDDAVSFLEMMPNLVDCSFKLTRDENPRTTVRMAHLRRLNVSIDRPCASCVGFHSCLEVPVLEEIYIILYPKEVDATTALIRRNQCPICAITVHEPDFSYYSVTDDSATALSDAVLELTKLTILGHGFNFAEVLSHQTKPIFPNLDHLSIIVKDKYAITETLRSSHLGLVTDVLQVRPRLRTLHLSAPVASRRAKGRFERDLQSFHARGIDISLHLDATEESTRIVDETDSDSESDEENSQFYWGERQDGI